MHPTRQQYIDLPLPHEHVLKTLFHSEQSLTIFDIGACEGEDAVRYARLFPNAEIYAFEPLPENVRRIQQVFATTGSRRLYVVAAALSDRTGEARFYQSSGQPYFHPDWDFGNKSSSLLPPNSEEFTRNYPWLHFDTELTVQTRKIVEVCRELSIRSIDYIHMDVQGAELLVLRGCEHLLQGVKAIWLEVSDTRLYHQQALRDDVAVFMQENGFTKAFEVSYGVQSDVLYVQKVQSQHCSEESLNLYNQFHSQFGEDAFLEANGLLPDVGVFVDVGAGHPMTFSNTYRLEQRGWAGLCVDADPRQVALLKAHRKNVEHYAICRDKAFVELCQIDCPELSTTLEHLSNGTSPVATLKVPAIDLESLLEKHQIQKIDLLSIDTEGTEIEVLESMDLMKHAPDLIIAEFNTLGRAMNEADLREYFDQFPYFVVHRTCCNLIFKRLECPTGPAH